MESVKYRGHWWLPDKPQEVTAGDLFFSPDEGARLEILHGAQTFHGLAVHKMIHGITEESQSATLIECRGAQERITSMGGHKATFLVDKILLGASFKSDESILFDSLSIHYLQFDDWLGISPFSAKADRNEDKSLREYAVTYTPPPRLDFRLQDFALSFRYDFNTKLDRCKSVINHQMYITLNPNQPVVLEKYLFEYFYQIQNFLTLAMGMPISVTKLFGKPNMEAVIEKSEIQKIEILYSRRRTTFSKQPYDRLFAVLRYSDISDCFSECLRAWFQKSEVLSPIYNLYFSTLYNPTMYLEQQFLSLCQALETYHSRVFGGQYIVDNDYDIIKTALLNAIPQNTDPDLRTSLTSRLKYGNQFSLRKRLHLLLANFPEVKGNIIRNDDLFVNDVVDTRNYYTHYSKELEAKAKTRHELFKLVEILRFVLEVLFLREIGIADDKISAIFLNRQRYARLIDE